MATRAWDSPGATYPAVNRLPGSGITRKPPADTAGWTCAHRLHVARTPYSAIATDPGSAGRVGPVRDHGRDLGLAHWNRFGKHVAVGSRRLVLRRCGGLRTQVRLAPLCDFGPAHRRGWSIDLFIPVCSSSP